MSAKHPESGPANGTEIFIPLNRLKKSPKNARKVPHSEAAIEAYSASIAAKGILQNLVVEPEVDADGKPTGFYLVTIRRTAVHFCACCGRRRCAYSAPPRSDAGRVPH
jgi:ParB family chromosome partitioning protein